MLIQFNTITPKPCWTGSLKLLVWENSTKIIEVASYNSSLKTLKTHSNYQNNTLLPVVSGKYPLVNYEYTKNGRFYMMQFPSQLPGLQKTTQQHVSQQVKQMKRSCPFLTPVVDSHIIMGLAPHVTVWGLRLKDVFEDNEKPANYV